MPLPALRSHTPGAAPGRPIKTGARVRRFRGSKNENRTSEYYLLGAVGHVDASVLVCTDPADVVVVPEAAHHVDVVHDESVPAKAPASAGKWFGSSSGVCEVRKAGQPNLPAGQTQRLSRAPITGEAINRYVSQEAVFDSLAEAASGRLTG